MRTLFKPTANTIKLARLLERIKRNAKRMQKLNRKIYATP